MENFNKLFKDIFFIAFVALLSTTMVFVLATAPFFELIKNVFSFKVSPGIFVNGKSLKITY